MPAAGRSQAPPAPLRNSAKSSARNPLRTLTAMANASPSASIAVVEVVGARPSPQASRSTEQSRATSLAVARVDSMRQQKLISASPLRLSVASRRRISSVSPLAESAITTSPAISTPRSPCTASAGCRNSAGLPVELSVAAIFCAMMPLLPMPVTTTRPLPSLQRRISSTARSKSAAIGPSSRAARTSSADASVRTRSAGFRLPCASFGFIGF